MKPKIYVDGQEGTTGLRIHDYLAERGDLEVLRIDPDKRRDTAERQRLLNAANLVFLCLPDVASREAIALIDNPRTRVIDASTAYRTNPEWVYGIPELDRGQRGRIAEARRVCVPGCHATGFILPLRPLVQAGLVRPDAELSCFSLTGYSGAGKKMIAVYEAAERDPALAAPRPYALGLSHKHLPEMMTITGLSRAPLFIPVICAVHSGMAVEVALPRSVRAAGATAETIGTLLSEHYAGERFVRVLPRALEESMPSGFLDMTACNNTNRADIVVLGGADQVAIFTRLDNLGKGASGAAVQCMNLMLGADESLGLSA